MANIASSSQCISVIIPVHNRLEFFRDALESVYSQSHRPIEIIIVENGSSEENREQLKNMVGSFKADSEINLKLIISDYRGAPYARNLGFKNSSSQFIQFLDSDDVLLPDKLSEQLTALNHNHELDMVYSKAQHTNESLVRENKFWGRKLDGSSMDFFLFSWQTMCPLYRRDTILRYGLWDESLHINQDWEFSIRYIIGGVKTFFIDKVQCLFRTHTQGNIGSFKNSPEKIKSKWVSTQKVYSLLKEKSHIDSRLKWCFIKRWIYILLMTSRNGNKGEFTKQLKEIRHEVPYVAYLLLYFFRYPKLSRLVLSVLNYNVS